MTHVDDQPTPATARGIFDPHLLDRCISCGFCLPACPTYAVSADEGSSPRGRITLMRALEVAGPAVVEVPIDYRENLRLTQRLGALMRSDG